MQLRSNLHFSTVRFTEEAAPGEEVWGFSMRGRAAPVPSLLSRGGFLTPGPTFPPLPSPLELGAGGLTAAGGPARVPPLGALWPGLGSGAAPAPVGTSSVAYRKVFRSSFQTMLKTIFLFVCFLPELPSIPNRTPIEHLLFGSGSARFPRNPYALFQSDFILFILTG